MAPRVKCEICDREFKNSEALEHHKSSKHPSNIKEKTETKKSGMKMWLIIGIIAILVIAGFVIFSGSGEAGQYDAFAQCLTGQGVTMFGAYWCPHCQDQKEMFGASWKHVNYVECSLPNRAGQTAECNAEGIQSYPTWEFGDGTRQTGVIPLEQLSARTGCPLN